MKRLAVTVFSLALLASCSVQTDHQVTADGTAANVAAGGEGACCGDAAGGAACCGSTPTKAQAMAQKAASQKAETKGEACADCCGACAPEAEAKQP